MKEKRNNSNTHKSRKQVKISRELESITVKCMTDTELIIYRDNNHLFQIERPMLIC